MPKPELEKVQVKKLRQIVKKAYSNNKFYHDLYKKHNINPGDIKKLEDIQKLPFLEKKTVRTAYPYGTALVPREQILELHTTSGTTGKPTPCFATEKDIDYWGELNARELWMTGIRPGDVLLNSYGYGLPTGGFGFHYGALKMGCMVIPKGTGETVRQIQLILDFGVTAVCMTPSYAIYIGQKAKEDGINIARKSKLRIGLFGAEPWSMAVRNNIEKLFGITAYDEYGMTEFLGPGQGCECSERDGMHTWADAFILECIDPKTGEWVDEGEPGELVWTWISADGTGVIRYRSRDLSSVWWDKKCKCGRTHPKFAAVKGRTDDSVSIGGFIVYPSQVEEVLMRHREIGANFRMVIENVKGLDKLTVKAEVQDKKVVKDKTKSAKLAKALQTELKSVIGLKSVIELVPPDTLPRSEAGESKTATHRVEDRRK
jgi:phenylacetate-CoA ligase